MGSLTSKFQSDIAEAKRQMAGPQKKADTESEIEKEADEALKDPESAQKLKQDAEKAGEQFRCRSFRKRATPTMQQTLERMMSLGTMRTRLPSWVAAQQMSKKPSMHKSPRK